MNFKVFKKDGCEVFGNYFLDEAGSLWQSNESEWPEEERIRLVDEDLEVKMEIPLRDWRFNKE